MKYKLILASNSPRRKQLLSEAGLSFEVRTLSVSEDYPDDLAATDVAEFLANKKGLAYQALMSDDELVITADTTVIVDAQVLNKPNHAHEAKQMLQKLSGKVHQVVTGVCMTTKTKQESFTEATKVYFRQLEESEIDYYITHYQPYDKAGGYAIQEWIGMVGIEKIEGSYFNVVGLPLQKLYNWLKRSAVLTVAPH